MGEEKNSDSGAICGAPARSVALCGLSILAENRGKAPCRFVLHVFDKEPKRGRTSLVVPGYDFTKDDGFCFTLEGNAETEPGKCFKMDLELVPELFEANALGPKIWFRCPDEIRGVFYLHYLVFGSKNLLARPGTL